MSDSSGRTPSTLAVNILLALHRYHVLSRSEVQQLFFGGGKSSGRHARRKLQQLLALGLITRHTLAPYNQDRATVAPVYYLSKAGRDHLARTLGDSSYHMVTRNAPRPDWLRHWLAIARTHIKLDQAVDDPEEPVQIAEWINEYDLADPSVQELHRRFRLYTLIADTPRRLTCQPDAGFVLRLGGHERPYFLEQDRGSSWEPQVAKTKCPGYAGMMQFGLQRTIFPESQSSKFFVLLVTTDPGRRDRLRRAIAGRPCCELWKFATDADLSAQTFLRAPIWYVCGSDEPQALVKPAGQTNP